jgi:hypothetical protein
MLDALPGHGAGDFAPRRPSPGDHTVKDDAPRSVAIVGASADRAKFGNKSVRAHLQQGWQVFPIHPQAAEIEGLKVYRSLRDLPRPVHRVSLYVPAKVGLALVDDLVAVGAVELFVNPGAESPELIERMEAAGLNPIQACSILALDARPADFPDA